MSWDVIGVAQFSCPCGAGTYSSTTKMDDWNRFDSSMSIECPSCLEQYEVFKRGYYRSGMYETVEFLVKKHAVIEHKQLIGEATDFRTAAVKLRVTRFQSIWRALFAGKNRRQVWELLTDSGKRYPALGTFYKHTKNVDLQSYLDQLFRRSDEKDSLNFLRIMSVEDQEINDLYSHAAEKESEAHEVISANRFVERRT